MISDAQIEKLLSLSRMAVSSEEKEKLRHDVESILGYVGEIEKAVVGMDAAPEPGTLRNVMREDGNPHESGIYTEALLRALPSRDGDYMAVKKILP